MLSASVDGNLLGLHNSSDHTHPHPIIANLNPPRLETSKEIKKKTELSHRSSRRLHPVHGSLLTNWPLYTVCWHSDVFWPLSLSVLIDWPSGTFAGDTLRLIRDVHIRTLDDVIRIHEDLCTVVSRTASAFSVWFLLHWISHETGCIFLMIRFCVEIQLLLKSEEYKAIPMSVASNALLLLFYLYLFVFPCVIAAGISGNCAGEIHIITWSAQ